MLGVANCDSILKTMGKDLKPFNGLPLNLMKLREQLLIEHAEQLLGAQLSRFLLVGYGDRQDEEKCTFLLTLRGHNDARSEQQITVMTAADRVLPRASDPLVLAALLWLFNPLCAVLDRVQFESEDLLDLLGWPRTEATRTTVDVAIDRYAAMFFESKSLHGRRGGGRLRATEMCSLFTGHNCFSEALSEAGTVTRTEHTLSLSPTFAESLRKGCSVFAGVNFGRVLDIRRLPSGVGLGCSVASSYCNSTPY